MNLKKVKQAIQEWDVIRKDPAEAAAFITNGCCFEVKKSVYNHMKTKNPTFVHAYLGIDKGNLIVVLIDNVSDAKHDFDGNYFICKMLKGAPLEQKGFIDNAIDGNVTVKEALQRVLRWSLYRNSYFEHQTSNADDVFKAFTIPIKSFVNQFAGENNKKSLVTFGMQTKEKDQLTPELLLWATSITTLEAEAIKDVDGDPVDNRSCPVPPYGSCGDESDFGL